MAGARSLLARVQRLEHAKTVRSPISRDYGSFDAFAAECEVMMDAGKLDRADFPVVLYCLRKWETDGTWGSWQRRGQVWEHGR